MAKGQKRSSREQKKPKTSKKKHGSVPGYLMAENREPPKIVTETPKH